MTSYKRSPDAVAYVLLVGVGCLIAFMLPLSKAAINQGVPPLAYAFWQAMGGGLLLFLWSSRQIPPWRQPVHCRYALVSGLTAIAIPNGLAFVVVGQVGAGLTATLYALPSLLTYALALAVRMEEAIWTRSLGLALGVVGCAWILWPRDAGLAAKASLWLAFGLGVPLSLAIGNIYRSRAWPNGAHGHQLAYAMLFAGALLLAVLLWLRGELSAVWLYNDTAVYLLLTQSVITALGYLGLFELQRRTSPVFLSQIGFVITLTGLALGKGLLNEQVNTAVWVGVLVVLTGMLLANRHAVSAPPLPISSDQ